MLRGSSSANNLKPSYPFFKNGVLEKQWNYDVEAFNNVDRKNDSSSKRRSRFGIVIRCVGCDVPGGLEALLRIPTSELKNPFSDNTSNGDTNSYIPEEPSPESYINNFRSMKTSNKKVKELGSRLLKVAKGTTERIERGMTGMAIRADQGKRPDWTHAACFITTPSPNSPNGFKWEHIGDTDSVHVNNNGDTVFRIPIDISEDIFDNNFHANFIPVLQVKLQLRSGAGLLNLVQGNSNKSGGVGKHYTVGTANFRLSEITSCIQKDPQNAGMTPPKILSSPIQSSVHSIHNTGQIIITILPDLQFPLPNIEGYSLTDPLPNYCHPFTSCFHPPLQQQYASQFSPNAIQVASERAIESTVVLPCAAAVTKLLVESASISSSHAFSLLQRMKRDQFNFDDPAQAINSGYAYCTASVGSFWKYSNDYRKQMNLGTVTVNISLQSPVCVFEQHLGNGSVVMFSWNIPQNQYDTPPNVSGTSFTIPFSSKVCDPKGEAQTGRIGSLSFEVVFNPMMDVVVDDVSTGIGIPTQTFEGVLNMDQYFKYPEQNQGVTHSLQIPMYEQSSNYNAQAGVLAVDFVLKAPSYSASMSKQISSPNLGLVSTMGIYPSLDGGTMLDKCTENFIKYGSDDPILVRRHQQLETMGDFLSIDWLQAHANERAEHVKTVQDRFFQYINAISNPQYNIDPITKTSEFLLPNEKKEKPAPFRPSSAKKVEIMTGIPINVHVQSIVMQEIPHSLAQPNNHVSLPKSSVYANVTCGACADHPAGYKKGGLRRLETKRQDLLESLQKLKTDLIVSVQNYMHQSNTSSTGGLPARRYVNPRNTAIAELRASCIEAEENLAALTWECAVRRGNVLSQAIAIALTSFLSSTSNLANSPNINEINAKAELWKTHGYLLCFEGLLSAAGNELGMIEDTSVAIDMLNTVSIQFVAENGNFCRNSENNIPVCGSKFIRWINLDRNANANNKISTLILQVGLDSQYYSRRLPSPLQNGAIVKLYAVLFEMGVDIRQWGANTSAQARLKIADAKAQAGSSKNEISSSSHVSTSLFDDDEDEDDESMDQDNDILTTLNLEAFRKLNVYAESVFPQPKVPTGFAVTGVSASVHPILVQLWDYIRSSAGKMQHGVIDAAAAAAGNLSGGGIIFCKSGKDRTAMQVTLKQAQFCNSLDNSVDGWKDEGYQQKVYKDATLMRVYGTRLAICEKNVGQPKFAFNTLQVKFMPEMLRPPTSVLAGFLKGGQVFTGKGFIES